MIRKVARMVIGIALLAVFWGGCLPARSPVGSPCEATRECGSGLRCNKRVCEVDPNQKAIEDAIQQGEQYGH